LNLFLIDLTVLLTIYIFQARNRCIRDCRSSCV